MLIKNLVGYFILIEYHLSHKRILYRHTELTENGETKFNQDIIFESVYYLEVPTKLENVKIYSGNQDDFSYVKSKCPFEIFFKYDKVYILEAGSKKHYIGAKNIKVNKNKLEPFNSGFEKEN